VKEGKRKKRRCRQTLAPAQAPVESDFKNKGEAYYLDIFGGNFCFQAL